MALSLVVGSWTGNITTPASFLTLSRPGPSDIVLSKDDPGETIFARIGQGLDQPMTSRVSYQSVADVFKGSPLQAASGQRVDGCSILFQLNEAWKVYDSGDASVEPYYIPASAHIVMKIPTDALVTPAVVKAFIGRLVASIARDSADDFEDAIEPILYGSTHLDDPAANP